MKEHARIGAEIVATIPGSVMLQKAVEHHHEAFDGSGYPNGLRGEANSAMGTHRRLGRRLREHDH